MSDSEYTTPDSSIREDESISFIENQPEQIQKEEYEAIFDEEETDENQKTITVTITQPTDSTTNDELQRMMQQQSPSKSPIKQRMETSTHADTYLAPTSYPNALTILDPTDLASHVPQPLSHSERTPVIARLVNRLHTKERASSKERAEQRQATQTSSSTLLTAVDPAAIPLKAISSLAGRIRATPVQPLSLRHVQPEHVPLPSYAALYQPPKKIKELQQTWKERDEFATNSATTESSANKENRIQPSVARIDAPPPSSTFPANAVPLKLLTAQLRVNASLKDLETHDFERIHSHTVPHPQIERDFPEVASLARKERYVCRNPPDVHRPEYLEPLLNSLYVQRMNPATMEAEANHRAMLHQTILLTNSIRTGGDLLNASRYR